MHQDELLLGKAAQAEWQLYEAEPRNRRGTWLLCLPYAEDSYRTVRTPRPSHSSRAPCDPARVPGRRSRSSRKCSKDTFACSSPSDPSTRCALRPAPPPTPSRFLHLSFKSPPTSFPTRFPTRVLPLRLVGPGDRFARWCGALSRT